VPPTLTPHELREALLARQLLVEPASLPIPRVLERMGGLQDQYAPSGYIGLWSRVAGFERPHLTRSLERRTVIQATLMRGTIHLVSRRDYWPLAAAIRRDRQRWWLRIQRVGATDANMRKLADRVRELLRHGPLTRSELIGRLGVETTVWNGVGGWVELVRVPPSGTWERRRADLYATAEEWIGPSLATEAEGLKLLVRRYLGGFGPASAGDIASWAGISLATLTPALEAMRLRRFVGEDGGELLDLPGAPLPDPGTPVPARFLPTWDATLLVHARRTQILPERYRGRVFDTKTPHSFPTFLVDGRVAGTWSRRGRIELQPFDRLTRGIAARLRDEAERLEGFLG
jgi:Winged helix DNA-binding domain